MIEKKPKVLFFSTTTYRIPIDSSIKAKFETLSPLATIKIFAYKEGLSKDAPESSMYFLFTKPRNRFIRYIKTIFLSFFYMRQHFSKADIVVVQDPILSFFVVLSMKFIKPDHRPKIVVESHGDFIETISLEKNLTFPSLYKYIMKFFAKYSLAHADYIRVISSSTRKQVNSFILNKPIAEFPAWIDLEDFIKAQYKPEKNSILFLGSISQRKNPLLLLRALNYLKKRNTFQIKIVGPQINNKYLKSLTDYVSNNALDKSVLIEEEVSQEGVINYLSSASLLVLPSISEGLGRVILEAQAVGCPVLVSDAGGMKDLIKDGETGFVFKSEDLEDLSEKISYILDSDPLRKSVSLSAKNELKQYYGSNNFFNGYKEIFSNL